MNSEELRKMEEERPNNLSFIITNARSIKPKLISLMDYMTELDLSFSVITETWLHSGEEYNKMKNDLKKNPYHWSISAA